MYDQELKNELLTFKIGAYTIEDINFRNEQIRKIVQNRTKEKLNFLNLVLESKTITQDEYQYYIDIVKSDYKTSNLFLRGFLTEYEI